MINTDQELKQEDIILDQNLNWLSDYYKENFLDPKLTEEQIRDHLSALGYKIEIKNLLDIYSKGIVESITDKKDSCCLGIISLNKTAIVFLATKIEQED